MSVMETCERTIKKRKSTLLMTLRNSETVCEVRSLRRDLLISFKDDSVKTIRLVATDTEDIDSAFIQLVLAAKLSAQAVNRTVELSGLSNSVSWRIRQSGASL